MTNGGRSCCRDAVCGGRRPAGAAAGGCSQAGRRSRCWLPCAWCDILLQCCQKGSACSRTPGVTYPPARRRDLGADRHTGRGRGGRGAGLVRVCAGHRDRQPGQVGRSDCRPPGAASSRAAAAHLGGTGAARIGRHGDDGPAYRYTARFWFCPSCRGGGQCRAPGPGQGPGSAARAGGRDTCESARGPAARHTRGDQPGHASGHQSACPAGPAGAAGVGR